MSVESIQLEESEIQTNMFVQHHTTLFGCNILVLMLVSGLTLFQIFMHCAAGLELFRHFNMVTLTVTK